METPKEYYYTYYSYEEWGRGYIGSRGCKCLPEEDVKYFGSYTDKTFHPTQKIILEIYETREEAYTDEIILQQYYKVVENPYFANRAYQTSVGFSVYGIIRSEETKRKNSESMKGKNNPNYGKSPSKETRRKQSEVMKGKNNPNYGKSASEETRRKKSEVMKGKNNPNYGKSPSKETRRKQSEVMTGRFTGEIHNNYGKKWWNDGRGNEKLCLEYPGKGWVSGRRKKVIS